jgi:hypothetical protein
MDDKQSLSEFLSHPHDNVAVNAAELMVDMMRRAGVRGYPMANALLDAACDALDECDDWMKYDEAVRRVENRRLANRQAFREWLGSLPDPAK